jgi:hypothetical protein
MILIFNFKNFFKFSKEEKSEEKVSKEFDIDEFNHWFKTEFDGYDGRKGAPGIYLRTDKLSQYWIKDYLELIGQDTSHEKCIQIL